MANKKMKRQLSFGRKLLYAVITVALVAVLIYAAYYLFHFVFFDAYEKYLSSYELEEATELVLGKKQLSEADGYYLVTETDTLEMYLNPESTDVAIRDKRSGVVTFAVPQEADNDEKANKTNKNYLKSHVVLTYFNSARTEGTYDSWSMSVEREQFTIEAIQNGIRVTYDMGDYSNSLKIPMYLSEEKFDELISGLDEDTVKSMNRYYSTNSDVPGMRQLLKSLRSNKGTQSKIKELLESLGFTDEDMVEQMAMAGSDVAIPVSFTVALEYRLVDDHLDVSVPVKALEENGGASIYKIQLLRNFAAADESEEGYLVVPNGDGSIIRFNNGKSTAATYTQYIYGIDPVSADYVVMENAENATMRLFGICREDSTILATVEDGASLTMLTAGVAGKINGYNYVYPTFVVRGSEKLEMFGTTGNEAALPLVEPIPYDCNLTVRYSFLDESHNGYSGIANYYRERLVDEGVLTLNETKSDVKFYYDVIAGVKKTESFLGKQYMGLTAMTTFEEAEQMVQQLSERGIQNQTMNLQGWFNDGYYHDVASSVWVNWKLGGKSGLKALNETLESIGGSLYGDVAFQKVTFEANGGFSYNYKAENAKYYSGYAVSFAQVNPVNFRQTSTLGYSETGYDLVSPKFLPRYVEGFADDISSISIGGISLRDLGNTLQSDKKRTEPINREEALDVVLAQLEILNQTGKSMMINSANDYTWSFADDIINLPLGDNEYLIIDEDIPLYEMIVHGAIDYCGGTYNLEDSADARTQILNMIEYGAAPHFVFTWQESSQMKYSGLNNFYATTFATWADDAEQVYDEVNAALSNVTAATIESHEILDNGIRKVSYSNGTVIYVNYSRQDMTADGVQIPAMGYVVD